MSGSFDALRDALKQLPGLGYRSAERVALHLVAARPETGRELSEVLAAAIEKVTPCPLCGNLSEDGSPCPVCADPSRDPASLCVIESVTDLFSIERSGVWRGRYHVLHGRLSPLHGVGPEQLNLATLAARVAGEGIAEVVFALPSDVESEATCHYIGTEILAETGARVSRIGFGLPSGGEVVYADPATLRNALEGRKAFF